MFVLPLTIAQCNGGGASGRCLGHKGGITMKGISALIYERPKEPLPASEDMGRRCRLLSRRKFLTRT